MDVKAMTARWSTLEQAQRELAPYKVGELKEIARELDVTVIDKTKAGYRKAIIEKAIGARLRFESIMRT